MNIIFYESTQYSGGQRKLFQDSLKLNKIPLITRLNDIDSITEPIDIVFYHTSNKEISFSHSTINGWHKNVVESIKIGWGGNDKNQKPINKLDNKIDYVNFEHLEGKLPLFKDFFSTTKTIQEIYNFLFDLDDEYENLLNPFATISPFVKATDKIKNKEGNLITVAKTHKKLNEYIKK